MENARPTLESKRRTKCSSSCNRNSYRADLLSSTDSDSFTTLTRIHIISLHSFVTHSHFLNHILPLSLLSH